MAGGALLSVTPDAPPVSELQLSTINRLASPMPIVAIAKYGPRSRNAGGPMISEKSAARPPPAGKVAKSGQPAAVSNAVAYAPLPKNAAWPHAPCPVKPPRTFQLVAIAP